MNKIRAVIDTNVFVSSFISANQQSPTVRIAKGIANGDFTPVFSQEILDEYEEVLRRSHFKFDTNAVMLLIKRIKEQGLEIPPVESDENFPDPDDKVFFCTAMAANTNLVTGNIKHYPKSAIVITPAEFCSVVGI